MSAGRGGGESEYYDLSKMSNGRVFSDAQVVLKAYILLNNKVEKFLLLKISEI